MRISGGAGTHVAGKLAAGTSTATVAGTVVASIEAAGGKQLITPSVIMAQSASTSGTRHQLKVTYTDGTDETLDGSGSQNVATHWNGAVEEKDGQGITLFGSTTKKIKKLEVITAGTSSETRTAGIAAAEIDE